MQLVIGFDYSKTVRGRLVLSWYEGENVVDNEVLIKHPFLLRVRLKLALWRMKRRQRKCKVFLNNHMAEQIVSGALPLNKDSVTAPKEG